MRHFYTAVWCSRSEAEFRQTVPLQLLGESIKFNGGLQSVILEGMDRGGIVSAI